MKILADENIPLVHEFFDSLGDVITVPPRDMDRHHTREADILVVRSVRAIDRALVENTGIRYVGTCTAGFDHLDIQALDELGIRWRSAPGCNAESVVDYVFSCLAALGVNFFDATVGIVGCGNVGGRLHRRLQSLGIKSHCYDPLLNQNLPHLVSLDAVLESDIVCLHAPLTRGGQHPSFHLLGSGQLQKLRKGATLISAGRGGVVDNAALKQLLAQRDDLQVVLDVWESEPDIDRELFERVSFGTPHIAGHAFDAKVRGTEMIYRDVCAFLEREPQLRFEDLDREVGEVIILQSDDLLPALQEA